MKLAKYVLFIAAVGLAGCSEQKSAQEHVEQAKAYINAQQFKESLIELKNAVQLSPKAGEIRYLSGKTHLLLGNGDEAVKALEKALEFEFNAEKVLPLLSRAYSITNADAELIELAPYVELLSDDVKVNYLAYKTLSAIRIGDIEMANEAEREANSYQVTNAYSHLASAYVDFSNQKLYEAQAQLSKLLTAVPEQPDAILLRGQIHTIEGQHEKASQDYKKYAQLQPNSKIIVLYLAESLLNEKKFVEAEAYADAILKNLPQQPFANYVKAMTNFEQKNYAQAGEYAEKALASNFKQGPLRLIAGASAYYQNNFEQSHHHLSAVVNYLVKDHPARKMLIVSQLQLGKVDEISDDIDQANLSDSQDVEFLSTLSYQLVEMGATEEAQKISDRLSNKSDSNSATENAREGILKLMLNDPSGMKDLKTAIEIDPDLVGAELALAYAAIQSGDYEQALAISDKWQQRYPDKPGSYNVQAAVFLKQGQLDLAKDAFAKSLAVEPKNLFALTELIALSVTEKDEIAAKSYADKAIEYFPENAKVLKYYYQIYQDDNALNKVKTYFDQNQQNMTAIILYSEVLMGREQDLDALSILTSHTPNVRTPKRWWQLNIIANKRLNNDVKVIAVLDKWRVTNTFHLEPVLLLVDDAVRNKNVKKALTIVNKALRESHPENLILTVTKIQILLDTNRIAEAKDVYQTLEKAEIATAMLAGFKGRILLLEKQPAKAEPLLSEFYQRYPTSQNVLLLALATHTNNKTASAITLLESHLAKQPEHTRVRAYLADLYLVKQPNKAISHYQRMLKAQPKNIVVLNNLAWLSMEENKGDLALDYAKQAYALAPQVPNIADTYAQVLLKLNKNREALAKQKEAFELSKGKDVDIAINYVKVLRANSRLNESNKVLQAITAQTDKQQSELNKLLEK